jgi:Ca2+-binding RTX toxin-like protein
MGVWTPGPGPTETDDVFVGDMADDTATGLGGADTISGMGGADNLSGGDGNDIIYGHSADAGGAITAVSIISGITGAPATGAATAADAGFLYIVSKDTGVILRVDATTGASSTFLDIPNGEFLGSGERGVLGMAFHPDYASNGRFFVYLTDAQGDLQIREYHRSAGDPTVADAAFTIVIEIPKQTGFSNHNGGWIGFSPDDGYLYIATGDGGGSGDPGNNAQDLNDLLGKIIRIDVNSDDFPGDPNRNYHIPNDNPFVGVDGLDEIWAYGVRNPWRNAFDPRNGDFYIADVGQGTREEVNFQEAGSAGGLNYGWRIMEGSLPFAPGGPGDPLPGDPSLILPVHEYGHDLGASITGGEVYVGPNGGMTGHYVFADFISGRIFSLYMNDGVATNVAERTIQLDGASLSSIADFVTGTDGNLYAIGIGGTVWRLDFANGAEDVGDTLDGGAGDDQLFGGVGDDVLIGGIGTDTIDGGLGDDTITYAMGDGGGTIDGGDGTDTLNVSDGFAQATLNVTYNGSALTVVAGNTLTGVENINVNLGGGSELDRLIYTTTAAITVNLATNTATGFASATGIEWVASGSGNDTLTGNGSNNRLDGGAGNDVLSGGVGTDTLIGGDGDDILNGGVNEDNINGGAGNDTINALYGDFPGSGGNDTVDGGADIDTFNVTWLTPAADMTINVGFNGTALTFMNGSVLSNIEIVNVDISGGFGQDTLAYSVAAAAVTVDMGAGTYSGFNTLVGIERVIGGGGGDSITGNNLGNALFGQGGADTVNGAGGVDQVSGGDGADTLSGGAGNDSIFGDAGNDTINWGVADGRDTVNGGADFDTFSVTGSAAAELGQVTWNGTTLTAVMNNGLTNVEAVSLNLGGGIDWLIYNSSTAVVVNLAAGTGSGLSSISGVEKVIGGSAGDTLTGDGADNRLDGQAGADTLNGGAGSDAVLGGDGDDVIHASGGNDSLQGQNGNDTFNWTSDDGRDTFNGGADTDTVNLAGSDFADDVAVANWDGSTITGLLNNAFIDIENINLDLGDQNVAGDWLRYNTALGISVDLASGTASGFTSIAGVENIIGGTGADTLTGDGGSNKVNGNDGADIIAGGAGNDNLTGGNGNDTFVYAVGAGADTINDFDAAAAGGQDFIDVSAFGINAGNFGARVAIIDVGADTVIRIDGTVFITLKGVSGNADNVITDTDFIFGP